ncbi:DUF502 domain-containing protein [Simiduia sp. 21SJ11W-1]|uniref:DUF502 domain-containing protein n=1 Tax=Simiduia sp. 21SJ11W-1 TaxID=2909669 RepID=UPI0020A1F6B7|nr:DUF502 domain-containing protein [Simiduia sp. 21SJ11W-1]UTA46596.1 DUF502 domain-containing protein [Simiduia sp. 21SJ11W-1]
MNRIKSFIWLTLLGGLAVVLPLCILLLVAHWFYTLLSDFLAPISADLAPRLGAYGWLADVLVIAGLLLCFCVIGLLVKTSVGAWVHTQLERVLKRIAPGYKTISDVVGQFLGGGSTSSLLAGEVALARIYGPAVPITVTVIVTAKHANGDFTVFMPTAPIPTSGVVYHLPASCIELLPAVSVEAAMRTIISCGAGSQVLMPQANTTPGAP